jgi:hypothetical protein
MQTSRVWMGWGPRAFLLCIMAGLMVLFWLHRSFNIGSSPFAADWLVVLLVELVLTLFAFSWHRIQVSGDELEIRWFPFYRKHFNIEDLESVTSAEVNAWKIGVGIRLVGGGVLAFVHRSGPAVSLTIKQGSYLVSLNNDEATRQLVAMLKETVERVKGANPLLRKKGEAEG